MSRSTVQIQPDLMARLTNLAAETHREPTELANAALAAFVEYAETNIVRIRENLSQDWHFEIVTDAVVKATFAGPDKPGA